MKSARGAQIAENLTENLRQHGDLVRGHDAVHPDRSACGGVGACRLMSAEVRSEHDLMERVTQAMSDGFVLSVEATRG